MAKTKESVLAARAAAKSTATKSKPKAVKKKQKEQSGEPKEKKKRQVSKRPAAKSAKSKSKAAPAENPFEETPPPGQLTLAVLPDGDASSKSKRRGKVVLGPVHESHEMDQPIENDQPMTPPESPTQRASVASFFEMCENDDLPPSPERPVRHDATRSREDVFGFAMRNVQRLHEHFGLDPLTRLSSNLSSLSVLSLYSGLGGAEISAALTTANLRKYVEDKELLGEVGFPTKPENVLACDIDQDCQKILKSHTESRAKLF